MRSSSTLTARANPTEKLGAAVLAAHVRALRDIESRNAGEPVETPQSAFTLLDAPLGERGGTLREALTAAGCDKLTQRIKLS
jgi:hypothetical protein